MTFEPEPDICPKCKRRTLPQITAITTAIACYLCGYVMEIETPKNVDNTSSNVTREKKEEKEKEKEKGKRDEIREIRETKT